MQPVVTLVTVVRHDIDRPGLRGDDARRPRVTARDARRLQRVAGAERRKTRNRRRRRPLAEHDRLRGRRAPLLGVVQRARIVVQDLAVTAGRADTRLRGERDVALLGAVLLGLVVVGVERERRLQAHAVRLLVQRALVRRERATELAWRRLERDAVRRRTVRIEIRLDPDAGERAGRVLVPAVDGAQEGIAVVGDGVARDAAGQEEQRRRRRAVVVAQADDEVVAGRVAQRRRDQIPRLQSSRQARDRRGDLRVAGHAVEREVGDVALRESSTRKHRQQEQRDRRDQRNAQPGGRPNSTRARWRVGSGEDGPECVSRSPRRNWPA